MAPRRRRRANKTVPQNKQKSSGTPKRPHTGTPLPRVSRCGASLVRPPLGFPRRSDGDGLGDRDDVGPVRSLERGADGEGFVFEGVEFVGGVHREHHACTAVRGGQVGVLGAVGPDGLLLYEEGNVSVG